MVRPSPGSLCRWSSNKRQVTPRIPGGVGGSLIDKNAGREVHIALTGLHSRVRDIDNKVEDTGLRRTNL